MGAARALIVTVADLHVGSPYAVCPARWQNTNGKELLPTPLQAKIREHWLECWQRVADLRRGARLIVLVLGDVIEGIHHGSTEIDANRLDVQERMAVAVLDEGLHIGKFNFRASSGDALRFVAGSDAHDGQDGESGENVAHAVLASDKHLGGRVTTDALACSVNGVPFYAVHKPGSGPGGRRPLLGNAYQSWLTALYFEHLESGQQPPRYVLSAHYHRPLSRDIRNASDDVVMTGVMLPAWKLKDKHAKGVVPFDITRIGMWVCDVDASGRTRPQRWTIELQQQERIAL